MKRERGLDFARAFAAIGIVVFHFYCHCASAHKLFLNNANGAWGTAINYLFFALSGYLLHSKYGKQEMSLTGFYYKRWKATMPAYIAVFLFAYRLNGCETGKLFYLEIPRWRLLLSFIGLDGYASWVAPTYFITGEWFLGAILVAYCAYPLLRFFAKNTHIWVRYAALLVLIGLYVALFRVEFWGLPISTNPITCLLCFYLGMLGVELAHILKKPVVVLLCAVLCGICVAVPLGGEGTTEMLLAGCTGLVVLSSIGDVICKSDRIYRVVHTVSGLTYPVFLIHHRIILKVLEGFNPVSTKLSLVVLGGILLTCFVFASILEVVMKSLFQSSLYLKFESLFQGKKE